MPQTTHSPTDVQDLFQDLADYMLETEAPVELEAAKAIRAYKVSGRGSATVGIMQEPGLRPIEQLILMALLEQYDHAGEVIVRLQTFAVLLPNVPKRTLQYALAKLSESGHINKQKLAGSGYGWALKPYQKLNKECKNRTSPPVNTCIHPSTEGGEGCTHTHIPSEKTVYTPCSGKKGTSSMKHTTGTGVPTPTSPGESLTTTTVADIVRRIGEYEIAEGRDFKGGPIAGRLGKVTEFIRLEHLDRMVAFVIERWGGIDLKNTGAFWTDTKAPRWMSILSQNGLAVLLKVYCTDPKVKIHSSEILIRGSEPKPFIRRAKAEAENKTGPVVRAEYREGESIAARRRRTHKLRDKLAQKRRDRLS